MVYGVGEGEGERTQRREALASDAAAVSALPPRSHPRLSAATIAATHAAAFISASRSSPLLRRVERTAGELKSEQVWST